MKLVAAQRFLNLQKQIPQNVFPAGRTIKCSSRGLFIVRVIFRAGAKQRQRNFAAVATLIGDGGKIESALTDIRRDYRLAGFEAQRTYILEVHSKQYDLAPQIVAPGEDLFDVNFIGQFSKEMSFPAF